nr:hypothetical protein [Parachlamydiaceae bacterium]
HPNNIALGHSEVLNAINLESVSECIKNNLTPDASIVLHSCSTGKDISPELNIAEKLNSLTGRTVFAPTADFSPYDCQFKYDGETKKTSFHCEDWDGEYVAFSAISPETSLTLKHTAKMD